MPLIKVNCSAIPDTLLESELFGHVRGAFTGATVSKKGKFALADGSSIFLDEIGTMSPTLQAKLLRVLQERVFERVGDTRPVKLLARVIAATNRDLARMVKEGTFREDLYYRISTLTLRTPALRERLSDVPLLARHFAAAACARHHWRPRSFAPEALELLRQQPWKGNVRELRNVVERALILAESEPITAHGKFRVSGYRHLANGWSSTRKILTSKVTG